MQLLTKLATFLYNSLLMDDSTSELQQQAIMAALCSNWEEALKINQLIINTEPKNVDALNRLGRAYFELGDLDHSKKFYKEALSIDPYNQIAAKFLKRIEAFCKKGTKITSYSATVPIDCDLFIEEPGKTKLVTLLKVAEPQRLSRLSTGSPVNLVIKNRGLAATDQNDEYLGIFPDDLAHGLIRLIKGGNKYQAVIKNIKTNGLTIMVREIFRSARFRNQPSFLDGINVNLAYSSDHIIVPEDADEEAFEGEDEEEVI